MGAPCAAEQAHGTRRFDGTTRSGVLLAVACSHVAETTAGVGDRDIRAVNDLAACLETSGSGRQQSRAILTRTRHRRLRLPLRRLVGRTPRQWSNFRLLATKPMPSA